jgi:hypothetical protein
MTSKNDITGDKLATKPANDVYRDNWERIFGKKDPLRQKEELREKLRTETSGVTSFHTGKPNDKP